GEPASPERAANPSPVIGAPFVPPPPNAAVEYVCGFLKRFTSEKDRLEKFTPTSGPDGRFWIPGGKFCCTMKPAVRELNASWPLLRKAAVPAFVIASITSSGAGPAFKLHTPSTKPSRSTTATTPFVAVPLV